MNDQPYLNGHHTLPLSDSTFSALLYIAEAWVAEAHVCWAAEVGERIVVESRARWGPGRVERRGRVLTGSKGQGRRRAKWGMKKYKNNISMILSITYIKHLGPYTDGRCMKFISCSSVYFTSSHLHVQILCHRLCLGKTQTTLDQ